MNKGACFYYFDRLTCVMNRKISLNTARRLYERFQSMNWSIRFRRFPRKMFRFICKPTPFSLFDIFTYVKILFFSTVEEIGVSHWSLYKKIIIITYTVRAITTSISLITSQIMASGCDIVETHLLLLFERSRYPEMVVARTRIKSHFLKNNLLTFSVAMALVLGCAQTLMAAIRSERKFWQMSGMRKFS